MIPPAWIAPPDLRHATAAQREIAAAVETADRFGPLARIAGADTSSRWRDSRGPVHAAIAWPGGGGATATQVPRFAYVPGYLGFREAPVLLAAWQRLVERPDLLLVDGQGRAHPRRCGIASHLGVLLDLPTIGVAKSLLCGTVIGELGGTAGSCANVVDHGERVAVALRTRAGATPIFVSTGHRVSLDSAVAIVERLRDGRRLPLPIRAAHDLANAARRAFAAAELQPVAAG